MTKDNYSQRENNLKKIFLQKLAMELGLTDFTEIKINNETRLLYNNLLYYFLDFDKGFLARNDISIDDVLDRSKGLYIHGVTGTGKTALMNAIHLFLIEIGESSYRVVWNHDFLKQAKEGDVSQFVKSSRNKGIKLYLDDLGAGQYLVNNFGTKINLYSDLIEQRYRLFMDEGTNILISSNLSPQNLLENDFDERTFRKITQMCNVLEMPKF